VRLVWTDPLVWIQVDAREGDEDVGPASKLAQLLEKSGQSAEAVAQFRMRLSSSRSSRKMLVCSEGSLYGPLGSLQERARRAYSPTWCDPLGDDETGGFSPILRAPLLRSTADSRDSGRPADHEDQLDLLIEAVKWNGVTSNPDLRHALGTRPGPDRAAQLGAHVHASRLCRTSSCRPSSSRYATIGEMSQAAPCPCHEGKLSDAATRFGKFSASSAYDRP